MCKTVLHSLIDLLDDTDTETIYKVLIKFVLADEPLPDEVEAIEKTKTEIVNGDIVNLSEINWD